MKFVTYILCCMILAGCQRSPEPAKVSTDGHDQPDIAHVAANYKMMQAMTKRPVIVDAGLAALCRGVQPSDVEAGRKTFGPHWHTAVNIFMNDGAATTFGATGVKYPVGSVIVKQKVAIENSTVLPGERSTAGVGGMIKRPAGYDNANGNWEYFYFNDVNHIEHGRIETCVQCHRGAAGKDYVFGAWAGGV